MGQERRDLAEPFPAIVIAELLGVLAMGERNAWLAEGWLGTEGAGGVKLNYHWIFGGETAEDQGFSSQIDGAPHRSPATSRIKMIRGRGCRTQTHWQRRERALAGW